MHGVEYHNSTDLDVQRYNWKILTEKRTQLTRSFISHESF